MRYFNRIDALVYGLYNLSTWALSMYARLMIFIRIALPVPRMIIYNYNNVDFNFY